MTNRSASKLFALSLALALVSSVANAQGSLGTATLSGPVLVDGQVATGALPLGSAVRVSTGDNGSVSVKLAQGGEIVLAGQADVIVTNTGAGPHVQLVCGAATVTSTVPSTISSLNGANVQARSGKAVVTSAGKSTTVKSGKTKDFNDPVSVAITGAESTAIVASHAKCNCNCR